MTLGALLSPALRQDQLANMFHKEVKVSKPPIVTHESFVSAVAALAIARVPDGPIKTSLDSIKLVYGAGENGVRGVTYFSKWQKNEQVVPFVEISAFNQESWIQIAGTVIHELGHVAAGFSAGHKKEWHNACAALGLRAIKAAGTEYRLAMLSPDLRVAIAALPKPTEGQPVTSLAGVAGIGRAAPRPCGAGIGTRGGTSRGKGSGSRLRLYQCGCGCKVRVSSDTFEAVHTPCGDKFNRV